MIFVALSVVVLVVEPIIFAKIKSLFHFVIKFALFGISLPSKKFSSPQKILTDCTECVTDIYYAVIDCLYAGKWQQCIEDILGAGNKCTPCVCEVVEDVCGIVGCGFSC